MGYWLRRIGLGLRLWKRDRVLWKLRERAERSKMLSELYYRRWNELERFGGGRELDLIAAKEHGRKAKALQQEIEDYSSRRRRSDSH